MAAPKGNQFWKKRSKHGRPKIFGTPDDLRKAAYRYFKWVQDNPLWEDKVFCYKGIVTHEPMAKMRAMSITGMCTWLGIDFDTWQEYQKRDDYSEVTREIENTMRTQKFEGASAELLNANIIARDLGLVEKREQTGSLKIEIVNFDDDDQAPGE